MDYCTLCCGMYERSSTLWERVMRWRWQIGDIFLRRNWQNIIKCHVRRQSCGRQDGKGRNILELAEVKRKTFYLPCVVIAIARLIILWIVFQNFDFVNPVLLVPSFVALLPTGSVHCQNISSACKRSSIQVSSERLFYWYVKYYLAGLPAFYTEVMKHVWHSGVNLKIIRCKWMRTYGEAFKQVSM